MSRRTQNYDDDYKGLGDFSDYDYYYGNPDRGRPQSFESRRGSRYQTDDEDGRSSGRRHHDQRKAGSGTIYLIMTLFFVVMVASVLVGRMYVWNAVRSGNEPEQAAFASAPEEEYPSDTEPEPPTEEQRIEEELSAMTLEQKVGQLFMVRNNGGKKNSFKDVVSKTHAGGAILFAGDFKDKSAAQVRKMIKGLQSVSDGRMIIAVDEEGGDVVRVSSNAKLRKTPFLSPQTLYKKGGFELIKSDTEEKCKLLDSLGINMNLAPVADVCTSKEGFMYKRAFGKGANETADYVSTVVNAMKETPVASCVKHFPGYGNSKKDTHKGLDINKKSLEKLQASDLVPFERAISDGVDSILLTHTVVNAYDPIHPASLSSDVVKMIREDMGYDGLLITDGMEMGAVIKYSGNSGKACIMAVKAGVDILCAPKSPVSDYKAVLNAVKSGEISEERIDESVRRILRFKQRFGPVQAPDDVSSTESETESETDSSEDASEETTTEFTTTTTALPTKKTTATKPDEDGAVG